MAIASRDAFHEAADVVAKLEPQRHPLNAMENFRDLMRDESNMRRAAADSAAPQVEELNLKKKK